MLNYRQIISPQGFHIASHPRKCQGPLTAQRAPGYMSKDLFVIAQHQNAVPILKGSFINILSYHQIAL